MTHPNAVKGKVAERAVVAWLRSQGWPHAERSRAGWVDDRGDIDGIPGVVVEIKNEQRIRLAAYLDELAHEMDNAGADTGVAIVKRRGTADVGQWYAVMPVTLWAELLRESGR